MYSPFSAVSRMGVRVVSASPARRLSSVTAFTGVPQQPSARTRTRENAQLATVLAEERVRLEGQARELLRLSGCTTVPAELVISLGEGVMFKLHVENRTGIARETVAAMAELLRYRRD